MRAVKALLFTAASLLQAQTLETAGDLACTAYCSREQPGTSVMEILWRLSPSPLPAAERRRRLAQQTIEVSVYKDGFERGLFATLGSIAPKAPFRFSKPQLPGMRNASVTQVGTTNEATQIRLLRMADVRPESAAIRVDGVQPGMAYTWRVPASAGGFQLITCRAAICPVDSEPEPARRPAVAKPK